MSSNLNKGESNLPEDIKIGVFASNIDLLSVMESFASPEKTLVYEGVIFLKNTFVNIFDFVNFCQSLIRKMSTVKKKACF